MQITTDYPKATSLSKTITLSLTELELLLDLKNRLIDKVTPEDISEDISKVINFIDRFTHDINNKSIIEDALFKPIDKPIDKQVGKIDLNKYPNFNPKS